jgi:hypothetical protein
MRREVVLLLVLVGCGVPVDIGMLDETSGNSGSSGPVTDDATLTDSMTGQQPTSEVTSDTEEPPLPLGRRDFARVEGAVTGTGEAETGGTSASTSATSTSETGAGDPVPLGTLDITATTGNATCDDPFAANPCPATWTYSFTLPPELQFVGAAGRLEDAGGFFSEVGEAPVDCSFGGGTLMGNFEITAIDETHVAGRMFDLAPTMWETAIVFDAPICG